MTRLKKKKQALLLTIDALAMLWLLHRSGILDKFLEVLKEENIEKKEKKT